MQACAAVGGAELECEGMHACTCFLDVTASDTFVGVWMNFGHNYVKVVIDQTGNRRSEDGEVERAGNRQLCSSALFNYLSDQHIVGAGLAV